MALAIFGSVILHEAKNKMKHEKPVDSKPKERASINPESISWAETAAGVLNDPPITTSTATKKKKDSL